MKTLIKINSLENPLLEYLKDDPVRPDIPRNVRVSKNSEVLVLKTDDSVSAIVCVMYHDSIPSTIDELLDAVVSPTVAVFYTIWSYAAGAGRELIVESVKYMKCDKPNIVDYVTYSPKTELARRFHLKNGASVYRENNDSVNYKY
jgi:hypothetical protein